MITEKTKKQPLEKKEKKVNETADLQFENLIKKVIESQGYINRSDLKQFAIDILDQIEPLISKHVKNHFYEIGNYVINNINNNQPILEKKDAKTS